MAGTMDVSNVASNTAAELSKVFGNAVSKNIELAEKMIGVKAEATKIVSEMQFNQQLIDMYV